MHGAREGGERVEKWRRIIILFFFIFIFVEHFHAHGKLDARIQRRATCAMLNDAIKCRRDSGFGVK